jgi:hypothetical protein
MLRIFKITPIHFFNMINQSTKNAKVYSLDRNRETNETRWRQKWVTSLLSLKLWIKIYRFSKFTQSCATFNSTLQYMSLWKHFIVTRQHSSFVVSFNWFHIALLTYSMVQSPSREANWFAASQEIPGILWNPKVHYRTHKRPPPVPILG